MTVAGEFSFQRHSSDSVLSTAGVDVPRARRMHSFDRWIKDACQHHITDLEKNAPSYMRHTCASLVKRSGIRMRDIDMSIPPPPCRVKDARAHSSHGETRFESEKIGSGGPRRRREPFAKSAGATSNGGSFVSDDQSITAKDMVSPGGHTFSSPGRETADMGIEVNYSRIQNADSKGEVDRSAGSENFDAVIRDSSSLCNALQIRPRSQCTVVIRGTSFSSYISLVDAFSDTALDDSPVYDSDDGENGGGGDDGAETVTSMEKGSVFDSALYRSASCSHAPLTIPPPTPCLEKMSSATLDDVLNAMGRGHQHWSEVDSDCHGDSSRIESHRLEGLLGSCTDSEFGELISEAMQPLTGSLAKQSERSIFRPPHSRGSHEFSLPSPTLPPPFIRSHQIHHSDSNKEIKAVDNDNDPYEECPSKSDQSLPGLLQTQAPNLLWIIGGNILAGALGAAIASAGIPQTTMSPQQRTDQGEIVTPHNDGDPADDWFFQAASRVDGEEY